MNNKERIKISECLFIRGEEKIPGNFTSVVGEYKLPFSDKTGYYKLNSSFGGHPDLRELLASELLKKADIPCADIQLVYDDVYAKENGCLSISILKENEEFIELRNDTSKKNYENNITGLIERDIDEYKYLYPEISDEFLEERKTFLVKYIFTSAFLGNDDIKSDNCQIIKNTKTGKLRNPEYYDMGMSFTGEKHDRYFYGNRTAEQVLDEIYHFYPNQAKDVSLQIGSNLTRKYIKSLLNEEIYQEISKDERNRIWKELGVRINHINKANEILYSQKVPENSFTISHNELEEMYKNLSPSIAKKDFLVMVKRKLTTFIER